MSAVEPLGYERAFWGDCLDTFAEERKHHVYAALMGVDFDLAGRSVLDIGGGPVSMLLKCRHRGSCAVADPLLRNFPAWVRQRYAHAQIATFPIRGEDLQWHPGHPYDEAWIYNVLQHVDDPGLVVANARQAAGMVRIFEWVGIPAYEGHPHELVAGTLDRWLDGHGTVVELDQDGCVGTAYFGVFPS